MKNRQLSHYRHALFYFEALIEKGAALYKTLAAKLDATRMSMPAFKLIVTAVGDLVYRHTDGVIVSTIACCTP